MFWGVVASVLTPASGNSSSRYLVCEALADELFQAWLLETVTRYADGRVIFGASRVRRGNATLPMASAVELRRSM